MDWMESIGTAVTYIEDHITEHISLEEVADYIHISPFYFQKGFSMLCGFTVAEYIRNRRLSLAANELATEEAKVMDVPEGFITKEIPSFDWAVFPCKGPMPSALQDVNTKIFSEWLPALKEYEFAAGYCIEMYDDGSKYAKGTQDENYDCEIWIPVKKK